jgi:hypothetical protein
MMARFSRRIVARSSAPTRYPNFALEMVVILSTKIQEVDRNPFSSLGTTGSRIHAAATSSLVNPQTATESVSAKLSS